MSSKFFLWGWKGRTRNGNGLKCCTGVHIRQSPAYTLTLAPENRTTPSDQTCITGVPTARVHALTATHPFHHPLATIGKCGVFKVSSTTFGGRRAVQVGMEAIRARTLLVTVRVKFKCVVVGAATHGGVGWRITITGWRITITPPPPPPRRVAVPAVVVGVSLTK